MRHHLVSSILGSLTIVLASSVSFGGEVVVARYTPEGVEALAVGLDELGEFMKSKLSEDPTTYTVTHPDYWQ